MNSNGAVQTTNVHNVQWPCRDHFEVILHTSSIADAYPGQFLQVLCRSLSDTHAATMLRRPFSIGGMQRTNDGVLLSLLGHVVGPGTRWLSQLKKGDQVSIIGPLGSHFSIPSQDHHAILIAGGIGLPPIRWFGERLAAHDIDTVAIFGARNRELIPMALNATLLNDGTANACLKPFADNGIDSVVTTDDGSIGMHGRVTDALALMLANRDPSKVTVYACGPNPMLEAIGTMCAQHHVACEVALERVMGCGMGTCQSCVVPVKDESAEDGWRYGLCCSEGPVFDAGQLIW